MSGHPAAIAGIRNVSAAATARRHMNPSVFHCFINELLQGALNALAFCGRLLQQHEKHVLLAVDHEIAPTGTVPFQFAQRPRRRRLGVAGIGAHRKTEPETEAVAREIEIIAPHARARPDLVRRQQCVSLWAENGLALEFPAISISAKRAKSDIVETMPPLANWIFLG